MALSTIDFPHLILADLTAPSLPLFAFMTIPIFHLPWSHWSPWMNTTSPFKSWFFLALDGRLWWSCSAFKYSVVHFCHVRFLNFWIYLALFHKSLPSMLLKSSSSYKIVISCIIVFGVILVSEYHLPRKTMVCYSVRFSCPLELLLIHARLGCFYW